MLYPAEQAAQDWRPDLTLARAAFTFVGPVASLNKTAFGAAAAPAIRGLVHLNSKAEQTISAVGTLRGKLLSLFCPVHASSNVAGSVPSPEGIRVYPSQPYSL
jgi:hypothetical protein